MNQKQKTIIQSAIDVFSRYGVRRTTMRDIAEQAGLSRQTLYASYANKDDIVAASIGYIAEKCTEDVGEAWRSAEAMSEKLDIFFDIAIVAHYQLIRQMPDATDLMTGIGEVGTAELKRGEALKASLLAQQFAPYADVLKTAGFDPELLADFVYTSASSYKFTARDMTHLKRLLFVLKSATLALLGES